MPFYPVGGANAGGDPAAYPPVVYSTAANPTRGPMLRRVLGYGVLAAAFLASAALLAAFLGADLGVRTALLMALLAALPMLVVVPVYLWLDRHEAEPVRYLVFAFSWGALCAPAGALVLNTTAHVLFLRTGAADPDTLSAVVSAPPVEEGLKGLAVLLLLLFRRREFDGVVDGVVYAGMAGAGFAFVENILYLGHAYQQDGSTGVTSLFVMRCVMAPFAHPLFTACTGIGLGLAATRARTTAARIGFGMAGFLCAVTLHGIWNLSAAMGAYRTVYLTFQMPVFLGFLGMVILLRRHEGTLLRQYLSQYADVGWLSHPEVRMLASLPARRNARRWARAHGGAAAVASMRSFQDSASDLALLRARVVKGAAEGDARARERVLLEAMTTHRAAFVTPPVR
jgi:RsiW-degrading membrane proteinase PrsW (M82 family)